MRGSKQIEPFNFFFQRHIAGGANMERNAMFVQTNKNQFEFHFCSSCFVCLLKVKQVDGKKKIEPFKSFPAIFPEVTWRANAVFIYTNKNEFDIDYLWPGCLRTFVDLRCTLIVIKFSLTQVDASF